MKRECLLSCSRETATSPYPEPQESSPLIATQFPQIYFNIILASMSRSSELPFPFRLKNFVCISQLPLRSTCIAHRFFLDFIVLIVFGDERACIDLHTINFPHASTSFLETLVIIQPVKNSPFFFIPGFIAVS